MKIPDRSLLYISTTLVACQDPIIGTWSLESVCPEVGDCIEIPMSIGGTYTYVELVIKNDQS